MQSLYKLHIDNKPILWYYIDTARGTTPNKKEENTMKKMLEMYGYNTIEEAAHDLGLNIKDAARMIKEMYEEDTAPSPARG